MSIPVLYSVLLSGAKSRVEKWGCVCRSEEEEEEGRR